MILETVSHLAAAIPVEEFAVRSGDQIAEDIKKFIAPIAAILIGAVGLKYVFGDSRSLAGFIGFIFLGIFVYVLISYGQVVLNPLAEIIKSWIAG